MRNQSVTRNNDNGNEFSKTKHNANDNVRKARKVDEIADRLVNKLGNPQAREYYCLVAWSLPQSIIESNLEKALNYRGTRTDHNPKRYFTWLCEKALNRKV